LNRLPVVKNWIKERAQGKEFKDTVTIDYVGGDPRFVFSTTYDKLCVKNGLVVRTLGFQDVDSEEIRINTFSAY
jgi:hypothetical protein